MAEGGPPEINEQKKLITPLLQKPLVKGETWYLIDSKWFKQWKKYVGFDSWDIYSAGNDEQHPGPIDNSGILKEDDITQLKEHLIDELDYILLPKEGWEKLSSWYDVTKAQEPVARMVVEHGMFVKRCKVEVYLTEFKLCEDNKQDKVKTAKFSKGDTIETIERKMRELFNITESAETRLWNKYMTNSYEPLHERGKTVQDAELYQGQLLVIEQKNEDGSWARQLPTSTAYTRSSSKYITNNSSGKSSYGYGSTYATRGGSGTAYNHNSYSGGPRVQPGLCGLSNLGNTCFMNSALQCMSNVPLLSKYFLNDEYKDELNYDNPLGMNGEIAISYAELLKQMWSGHHSYTIPRNFKMQVGRFAPQFSGFQQQDAQELLAFLLDGLHEDLNRIIKKPYIEAKDSDGRADQIVAEESWENHLKRNHSIIVDLYHGQFKSKLVCPDEACGKVSVTFDPFCFLSLPLPVRKERIMEIFFVRLDGESKPLQLKVVVRKHGSITDLCKAVSKITSVSPDHLVVTDVYNHRFHKLFQKNEPLNAITDKDTIYIFEVNVTSHEDPETIVLPIYLREPRISTYSSSTSHHLFGTPMLIPVPRKGTTYQDLYEGALKKMRWFVTPPESDDWFHEENKSDLQNGDATMNSDDEAEGEDAEKDQLKEEEIKTTTSKERRAEEKPRLFRLTMVNPYGSSEVQKIRDDGAPLKLTNRTHISLDWNETAKEKFYNEMEARDYVQHESVSLRSNSMKKSTNLQECLKLFLTEEILEEQDAWYCPQCKEHKEASKKFDLWKLPKVLVIHLKRFSCNRYYRDKLDTQVSYPLKDLDLAEHLAGPTGDHGYKYDLVAVVNHYGGLGGGHYTAYAKNAPMEKWYYFDDSSVSSATEDQVLSKAAYVLFYIRQDSLEDFKQNGLANLVKLKGESMDDENGEKSGSDNDEAMDTN